MFLFLFFDAAFLHTRLAWHQNATCAKSEESEEIFENMKIPRDNFLLTNKANVKTLLSKTTHMISRLLRKHVRFFEITNIPRISKIITETNALQEDIAIDGIIYEKILKENNDIKKLKISTITKTTKIESAHDIEQDKTVISYNFPFKKSQKYKNITNLQLNTNKNTYKTTDLQSVFRKPYISTKTSLFKKTQMQRRIAIYLMISIILAILNETKSVFFNIAQIILTAHPDAENDRHNSGEF